ncbi:metallophosphoesterase [Algoriphagus sp.]|uniref:metallophosphoesterase family protein n=1 Tax=Algoriphagus sp. TaxID=1872435 RepID=UPI0025EC108B|nr:metallophosphoesterase [Algoriphagus sp.]
MKRRPFLQKLTFFSSAVMALPLDGLGKTIKEEPKKLRFIVASDGHFGQPDTDFTGTHKKLIESINSEEQVDFVVFNGDLVHDDPLFLPQVKMYYDSLKAPYYVTRGNHDRVAIGEWKNIWGYSENHSFQAKDGSGVILLNCSNKAGEYLCGDVPFLKSKLEELSSLSHVFVFIHISQNDWTRHGIKCDDLMELIALHKNVKAVFHGHDHDVDGIMINRGKPYLWDGHFGGNWGNPFHTYRVVEILEDGKTITYLKTVKDGTVLNGHSL